MKKGLMFFATIVLLSSLCYAEGCCCLAYIEDSPPWLVDADFCDTFKESKFYDDPDIFEDEDCVEWCDYISFEEEFDEGFVDDTTFEALDEIEEQIDEVDTISEPENLEEEFFADSSVPTVTPTNTEVKHQIDTRQMIIPPTDFCDQDGDSIADEIDKCPNTALGNADKEGCSDRQRFSCNDGIDDAWRLKYFQGISCKGHSAEKDSDEDGLSNKAEYRLGTDPKDKDTDGDGWSDKQEVDKETDPLNSKDNPVSIPMIIITLVGILGIVIMVFVFVELMRKSSEQTGDEESNNPKYQYQPRVRREVQRVGPVTPLKLVPRHVHRRRPRIRKPIPKHTAAPQEKQISTPQNVQNKKESVSQEQKFPSEQVQDQTKNLKDDYVAIEKLKKIAPEKGQGMRKLRAMLKKRNKK